MSNCSLLLPSNETDEDCGAKGLLLPILDETGWNKYVRMGLYLAGMLWTFLGISIAADVFMASIERITSKRNSRGRLVWNPTVANLTLMALGSSAPEILLSIIEIVGNKFHAGALGPSSIVGSAAFNLLVISAVCVVSIPTGERRKIAQVYVFAVTAVFSVFAYIWLILILKMSSPDEIEVWEAVLTLLFFFILVILAFLADKQFCCRPKRSQIDSYASEASMLSLNKSASYDDLAVTARKFSMRAESVGENSWSKLKREELQRQITIRNPHMSAAEVAKMVAIEMAKDIPQTRAYYRLQATGWLSNKNGSNAEKECLLAEGGDEKRPGADSGEMPDTKVSIIEFAADKFAALESEGHAIIRIKRTGNTKDEASVHFETIDGTATAINDYKSSSRIHWFDEDQSEISIKIPLIKENDHEPDEVFYVKLDPTGSGREGGEKSDKKDKKDRPMVAIGKNHIAEVTIVSGDKSKIVEFEKTSFMVLESAGVVAVPVVRSGCYHEKTVIGWETKDKTAKDGEDYLGGRGELVFMPGEVRKQIVIPIINDIAVEKTESFSIRLKQIKTGHCQRGKHVVATVTIIGDDSVAKWLDKTGDLTEMYQDELGSVGASCYSDQFRRALNVKEGNLADAGIFDYVFHVCSFGWKLIFAFVPPPTILGGWLTFFVGLALVGLLTAIVGDFAAIFGCLVGLKDSVTAITFVALGTSLPDLFASRLAAVQEPTADNSIGNITGSNSVNVFLGLGIPWLIASVYWRAKGQYFCVPAGDLAFTVTIFIICAVACLLFFVLRRNTTLFGRAELGGPNLWKMVTGGLFVYLWIIYVVVSALQAYGKIKAF